MAPHLLGSHLSACTQSDCHPFLPCLPGTGLTLLFPQLTHLNPASVSVPVADTLVVSYFPVSAWFSSLSNPMLETINTSIVMASGFLPPNIRQDPATCQIPTHSDDCLCFSSELSGQTNSAGDSATSLLSPKQRKAYRSTGLLTCVHT